MEKTGMNGQTRDRLIDDLKLVIRDAEEMLRSTGQQMDDRYQAARAKFESTLSNAKNELSLLEEQVISGTRDAIENADQYVRQNPWQAVGVGAFAGLVIGIAVGRR